PGPAAGPAPRRPAVSPRPLRRRTHGRGLRRPPSRRARPPDAHRRAAADHDPGRRTDPDVRLCARRDGRVTPMATWIYVWAMILVYVVASLVDPTEIGSI